MKTFIEGENWDGLSDMGDGLCVRQDPEVEIGLAYEQWRIILMAVNHYKKHHLPYEDDSGIYDIEFFNNLIDWNQKGLK